MTFLPIVERELRVAARKRSTYWTRMGAAIVSLVLFAGIIALAGIRRGAFGVQVGEMLFGTFSWLGFALACSSGVFLTADSLSEEKREGTLGLLFLTDLRGYDVVLGKLLSSSLVAIYGLFAAFPVMGLSFLLGGVTGGEFWRLMLVLCNTLFFSLAAGMLISSVVRDAQRAMVDTVLLCGVFIALLPLIDGALSGWNAQSFVPYFSLASPGYNMVQAQATLLGNFWTGLAVVHGFAWLFLGLACLFAPRKWQEPVTVAGSSKRWFVRRGLPGRTKNTNARRRQWLEVNPVRWLAAYDPQVRKMLWMVLGGIMGLFALLGFTAHDLAACADLLQALAFILILVVKLWLISQASRFFVDATRNGMIELLLATPLSPQQIVRGQVWALRRMFFLPLVLLICLTLASQGLQLVAIRAAGVKLEDILGHHIVSAVSSCVLTVTSLLSCAWFGMWMGMVSRKPNVAVIKTLVFVEILPWLAFSFVQMFVILTIGFSGLPGWAYELPPLFLSVAADFVFFMIARRKLLHNFRDIVARASGLAVPRRPPPLPGQQMAMETRPA